MSNAGYSDVPAYGRLHRTESLLPGATDSAKASLDLYGHVTLGPFIVVTPPTASAGLTHFWPALTVAREIGLSHPSGPAGGVGV